VNERELELKERIINDKEPNVVIFRIDEIENNFNASISSITNNLDTGKELEQANKLKEAQDIYRSQISFLESAFDYFIHSLIKLSMQEMYLDNWKKTSRYQKFEVPLSAVEKGMEDKDDSSWLNDCVNDEYQTQTFLSAKQFNIFLELIEPNLSKKLSLKLYPNGKKPSKKLDEFITKLYQRRNAIVHQDDRESRTGQKKEITLKEVLTYKDNLSTIVNELLNIIKSKQLS